MSSALVFRSTTGFPSAVVETTRRPSCPHTRRFGVPGGRYTRTCPDRPHGSSRTTGLADMQILQTHGSRDTMDPASGDSQGSWRTNESHGALSLPDSVTGIRYIAPVVRYSSCAVSTDSYSFGDMP